MKMNDNILILIAGFVGILLTIFFFEVLDVKDKNKMTNNNFANIHNIVEEKNKIVNQAEARINKLENKVDDQEKVILALGEEINNQREIYKKSNNQINKNLQGTEKNQEQKKEKDEVEAEEVSVVVEEVPEGMKYDKDIDRVIIEANRYIVMKRYSKNEHKKIIDQLNYLFDIKGLRTDQNRLLRRAIYSMNDIYVKNALSKTKKMDKSYALQHLNDALNIKRLDKKKRNTIKKKISLLKKSSEELMLQKQDSVLKGEKIKTIPQDQGLDSKDRQDDTIIQEQGTVSQEIKMETKHQEKDPISKDNQIKIISQEQGSDSKDMQDDAKTQEQNSVSKDMKTLSLPERNDSGLR